MRKKLCKHINLLNNVCGLPVLDREEEFCPNHAYIRRIRKPLAFEEQFPLIIDGTYYETADDFRYFQQTQRDFLDEDSLLDCEDDRYDDEEDFEWMTEQYRPSWEREWSGKTRIFPTYQSPPVKTLAPYSWELVNTIEHMHYIVARNKKHYFAVWLSLSKGTIEKAFETIFPELPSKIIRTKFGAFHSKGPFDDYEYAADLFNIGGETPRRLLSKRARMEDADWIPPNLRDLAHQEKWNRIPSEYLPKLQQWKAAGSPGWYKTNAIGNLNHRHAK